MVAAPSWLGAGLEGLGLEQVVVVVEEGTTGKRGRGEQAQAQGVGEQVHPQPHGLPNVSSGHVPHPPPDELFQPRAGSNSAVASSPSLGPKLQLSH